MAVTDSPASSGALMVVTLLSLAPCRGLPSVSPFNNHAADADQGPMVVSPFGSSAFGRPQFGPPSPFAAPSAPFQGPANRFQSTRLASGHVRSDLENGFFRRQSHQPSRQGRDWHLDWHPQSRFADPGQTNRWPFQMGPCRSSQPTNLADLRPANVNRYPPWLRPIGPSADFWPLDAADAARLRLRHAVTNATSRRQVPSLDPMHSLSAAIDAPFAAAAAAPQPPSSASTTDASGDHDKRVTAFPADSAPRSGFTCQGRAPGFYADIQTACRLFYVCDGVGAGNAFACPAGAAFSQTKTACQPSRRVNCRPSERVSALVRRPPWSRIGAAMRRIVTADDGAVSTVGAGPPSLPADNSN